SDKFDPGHETIEAKLFTEDEIPWEEIAFRTVREALQRFFEDRRRGSFGHVHTLDIV
ncbi:MAG: NUDIX hydrolase, partial [Variovorax sp.]